MFHPAHPTLPRFLALVVAIASLSPGAAVAEGWIPIGPTDVGMVTSLSAGSTAVYAATCNGVYRSGDGGSSWREAGLQRECVIRLAVDTRSDTIYAIVDHHFFASPYPQPSHLLLDLPFRTLWVSRDGGQIWTQTPVVHATAVGVDLSESGTAYVASTFGSSYSPLAVTRDSGATWTRVSQAPGAIISGLAIDARDGAIYGVGGDSLIVGAQGVWSEIPLGVSAVGVGSGADGAVYAVGVETFCRKTTAVPEWTCNSFPGSGQASILELPESESEARRILVAGGEGVWSSDDGHVVVARAGQSRGLHPGLGARPLGDGRLCRERRRRASQYGPWGYMDEFERGSALDVGSGARPRPHRSFDDLGGSGGPGLLRRPRGARAFPFDGCRRFVDSRFRGWRAGICLRSRDRSYGRAAPMPAPSVRRSSARLTAVRTGRRSTFRPTSSSACRRPRLFLQGVGGD